MYARSFGCIYEKTEEKVATAAGNDNTKKNLTHSATFPSINQARERVTEGTQAQATVEGHGYTHATSLAISQPARQQEGVG